MKQILKKITKFLKSRLQSRLRFFKKPVIINPVFKLIHDKGKCCISGKALKSSKQINIVQTPFVCDWSYPYWKPVGAGVQYPMYEKHYGKLKFAVAYVHDDAIDSLNLDSVKYVVEIKDKQLIYHSTSELMKDPNIFKQQNTNDVQQYN